MRPTDVEFQDRSPYREEMKQLLTIDPAKTVVLTVDMQREYLDADVASSPVLPDEAERVLTHSKELLAFARSQGIAVRYIGGRTRKDTGLDSDGLALSWTIRF